jgi:DUF4097 and DUF4098 domain-containing protein YvlB
MKKTIGALVLATALAPALASAQLKVDEQRKAAPNARIEIDNQAGSIRVIGWDQQQVQVTGTLGKGAEGLDFDGSREHIEIDVESGSAVPFSIESHLEIHVPAGAHLEIEGFASQIDVSSVTGTVEASTVNGSIDVEGKASEVSVETVNGSLNIAGPARQVEADSVNGTVTIRGASGAVEASTVNGTLTVEGTTFSRASLETVNGSVRFAGALDRTATLSVESVGGSVHLELPKDVSADFSISTFSGDIHNQFGPEARRTSRWTQEKELRFSTGSAGARVSVETLSGTVTLSNK